MKRLLIGIGFCGLAVLAAVAETAVAQAPAAADKAPSATNKEPAAINKEPAATNKEPAAINKEPAATNKEPARDAEISGGVIRLDETVISGNQELPKVLYILPWRDPNGLPEIELDARYSEMDVFRRLYPPAYRRELTYFESLQTNSLEATKSSLGTAKSSEK